MPNIVLPLTSVSQSVSRPVIVDIIQQVQKMTGISEDTNIFYPGDIQRMRSAGSGIDAKDRNAIFSANRINFIEVEEDYDVEAVGTTAVTRPEHIPVFEDGKLQVCVRPVYATTNVTINFTFRTPSKSEALRWRDEARVRVSQMYDVNLHDVKYHYILPAGILTIIKQIYDKREAKHGYGQTFEQYVRSMSTDRLTLVSDQVGNNANLAISETQMRIQGMFTFDALPEKVERDDTTGTWQIQFGYRFSYEKPIEIHIRYPVMVHNQLLDDEYVSFTNQGYDPNKINKTFTASLHAMNAFEMQTLVNARHKTEQIIRIPEYDDFIIPQVLTGTGSVLLALAEVDETNKRTLFNLRELGDFVIDDDILKFIQESEYLYLGKQYKSILNVSLYRNGYMASSGSLTCDGSLNIKATADLDPRNQHRVRLGIVTDLTLLPQEALKRAQKYPKAIVKLISAMNELLRYNPDFIKLADNPTITTADFSAMYSFLTGHRMDMGPNVYYGPGIDHRHIFDSFDPRVVENYRRNSISTNRVMISSVVALAKD